MAAGIGNPVGLVMLMDGGSPRIISAYARAVISGGCFVTGSTGDGVVSSGASTYVTSDIKVAGDASGNSVNGMAVQTAASGALVAFATRGVVICIADGTVTAGYPQIVGGVNGVHDVQTGSVAMTEYPVGRALTAATSGNYCLVHLNL